MARGRQISLDRIGEMMKAVLIELRDAGGEAKSKDLLARAEGKLALSDYEKEIYQKTGYVRWQSIIHFYSIDCAKAGYIQKASGKWYLTPQGEAALRQPPGEFIRSAVEKYRAWKRTKLISSTGDAPVDVENVEEEIVRQTAYDLAKDQAQDEIEKRINSLGPYQFQDLVAALLTAMGYHIPFIAGRGQDGGVDIIAYKDPLGTSTPRIRVQVKHRDQKVTVKEVRELEGILRKEGDVGLIVSSGGFTSEVEREIRSSSKHIETMNLDRVIDLWKQYYDHIPQSGKTLLPLVKLFFFAPIEE
jgi:restriction system protein